jgi:peptidyl-prolyl cis-trans isomerase C
MRFLATLILILSSPLVESAERSIEFSVESPVIASRGDTEITMFDLHGRLMPIPEGDRAGVISSPDRLEKLITDLLTIHMFANRAREAGVEQTEDFQAELHYMMIVGLADRFRDQWIAEQMLDDYGNQAREIYLTNPGRFERPGMVSFRHILIRDYRAAPEEKAERLLQRLRDGDDFSELARNESDDPSVVQNDGNLVDIDVETLDEEFAAGLARLSVGEMGLVQSGFGWHVVLVDERQEARRQEFEEVQADLLAEARQNHRERIMNRLMREAYSSDLELADGVVAEILERYPPPDELIEAIESSN